MRILKEVARSIAPRFTFGYYDVEDIEQEAIILGLAVLSKYDSTKGASLKTFLTNHIRRRLITLKRDKYYRVHFNVNTSTPRRANENKKNLMEWLDIDAVNTEGEMSLVYETDFAEIIDDKNLLQVLDRELPTALRSAYVKAQHNVYIPKEIKAELYRVIYSIMEDHGFV